MSVYIISTAILICLRIPKKIIFKLLPDKHRRLSSLSTILFSMQPICRTLAFAEHLHSMRIEILRLEK